MPNELYISGQNPDDNRKFSEPKGTQDFVQVSTPGLMVSSFLPHTGPGGRIFNFPDHFPAQDLDAEEDASKPPPYIRMA